MYVKCLQESEVLAARAASRNGQFLDGHQIGITQLRKSEMADAIRQNMIIIREMVCPEAVSLQ
jgi:hypothetical protein